MANKAELLTERLQAFRAIGLTNKDGTINQPEINALMMKFMPEFIFSSHEMYFPDTRQEYIFHFLKGVYEKTQHQSVQDLSKEELDLRDDIVMRDYFMRYDHSEQKDHKFISEFFQQPDFFAAVEKHNASVFEGQAAYEVRQNAKNYGHLDGDFSVASDKLDKTLPVEASVVPIYHQDEHGGEVKALVIHYNLHFAASGAVSLLLDQLPACLPGKLQELLPSRPMHMVVSKIMDMLPVESINKFSHLGFHMADEEHVDVILQLDPASNSFKIAGAIFFPHGDTTPVVKENLQIENEHLKVYVSDATHAMYHETKYYVDSKWDISDGRGEKWVPENIIDSNLEVREQNVPETNIQLKLGGSDAVNIIYNQFIHFDMLNEQFSESVMQHLDHHQKVNLLDVDLNDHVSVSDELVSVEISTPLSGDSHVTDGTNYFSAVEFSSKAKTTLLAGAGAVATLSLPFFFLEEAEDLWLIFEVVRLEFLKLVEMVITIFSKW